MARSTRIEENVELDKAIFSAKEKLYHTAKMAI
ncbi:hypothetical protein FHS16_003901 [Paenibacillus endophyticus]|uniref:Uncharacterized protein n=1 Tax=Paenibacillus endophyticus TaxID=1294268 RepID=A0A7W5C9V4_9BACL|nr:hypothetical protein [Paenibacillus endophyticus]